MSFIVSLACRRLEHRCFGPSQRCSCMSYAYRCYTRSDNATDSNKHLVHPSPLFSTSRITATSQVKLSVDLVRRLRFLAQHSGSSLFVTVLAAFKVLLAKYSSRDDLVVGTPSSGRDRPELQGNTVGCFVNLTALRTSLAGKVLKMHATHKPYTALRPFSHMDRIQL